MATVSPASGHPLVPSGFGGHCGGEGLIEAGDVLHTDVIFGGKPLEIRLYTYRGVAFGGGFFSALGVCLSGDILFRQKIHSIPPRCEP
jgi:hypothetical protein